VDPEVTEVCPVCGAAPAAPRASWSWGAKLWLAWWLALLTFTAVSLLGTRLRCAGWFPAVTAVVWAVSGIIWGSWYLERRRTLAMAEICRLMDFAFTEKVPKARLGSLGEFPLFNLGHSRRARNLMEGRVGDCPVCLLDYRYTVGAGKHQHTWRQTVVVVPAAAGLPAFQLSPESFLHKIGQLFGYQDINFAENPEFSRRYLLRGPDEAAIRAAFPPDVLEYFARHQGWTVESRAGRLLIYRKGTRAKPDACPQLVADALRIQALFS
jgi:hypothetical protein